MKPVLPPEARLLVLATRPASSEDDREISGLIGGDLSWPLLGSMAEREKLVPVLWSRLHDHAASLPTPIARRLQAQAAVTEFRMAMSETVIHDVVKRLAVENIRVMLLKGAALASTVYPSFAARPMGDLDILVHPDEAERAWQCMVEAGWRPEYEGGERFYEGHHHLVALVDPGGVHTILEIHRAILPTAGPFRLDEGEVWREAEPITLGSTPTWVPSWRHQLLHLCVHFAWSNMLFSGLGRTVRDIRTLLDTDDVDWDAFEALARNTLATSCAYWSLRMARKLSKARVPQDVLKRLRPPGTSVLDTPLERAHIVSALTTACPSLHLLRLLWSSAIRPRRSGHGSARPWQVGEAFQNAFPIDKVVGRGDRVRAQLRDWSGWLRFAGMVGLPRRVI